MNVVIEEIGYLGTSLEYPEVRDRIEIQQNKLAALSAKSERYNIISFGGAAMLWAGLTMLITQISVWMFLKLPGTRSAVVGADGKLSEDEQTNYMKLIGTVYAVAGISIASIMIGGGVL